MTDTGQIPGEGLPENAGMVEQPGIPAPDAYTFLDPSEHAPEDDDLLLMPTSQGAWSDPQSVPAQGPQSAPAPAPTAPAPPQTPAQVPAPQQVQAAQQVPAEPQPAYATQPQVPAQGQEPQPPAAPTVPVPSAAPAAQAVPAAHTASTVQTPSTVQTVTHGTHESGGRDTGFVDLNGVRIPAPAAAPAQPPAPVGAPAARRPLHRGPASAEAPSYAGGTQGGGVVRSLADRGPAGAVRTAPPARHASPPAAGPEYFDAPADEAPLLPGPQLGEIPPQGASPWGAAPKPQPEPEQPAPQAGAEAAVAPESEPEREPEPEEPVQAEVEAEPEVVAVAEAEAPAEPEQPVQADAVVEAEAAAPEAAAPVEAAPVRAEEPVQPEVAVEPEPVAAETVVHEPVDAEPVTAAQPEAPAESEVQVQVPEEEPAEALAAAPAELPAEIPVEESAVSADVPVDAAVEEPQAPVQQVEPAEEIPAPVPSSAIESPATDETPETVEAPEPAATVEPEPVVAPVEPEPVQLPAEPAAPAAVTDAEDGTGPEVIETPELEEPQELVQYVEQPAEQPTEQPVGQQTEQKTEQPVEQPVAVAASAETTAEETALAETVSTQTVSTEAVSTETISAETAPEDTVAVTDTAPAEAFTPPAPGYDDAEREAVLRVMRERRDIRNGFRSDPIPHEVLLRVLEAAHTAPSVGHSQPWDFVVIRSAETRRSMHELAQRQREAYAKSLPKGRAKQFKELKIEAILDTPVNIVVTADPTRGGRHTLGRHTQPQMAPYSSALAVENLWLAARAEGLGVGWVSFFDEREMVRALGLPEHLEVVAYLCVGYVDEFPEEPELLQAGWSKRRPLSWVVHEETYGRRALPGEEPHDLLQETIAGIRPLDAKALGEAWERQKRMTKPAGALGILEIISAQLSGLSRMCPPPIPEPAAVAIFAGDHGVHAQGVTAWPQEVTAQMVANFLGGGAVCNAFAAQVGAEVCVVDVGVATDLPATPGLLPRKVRKGTADFTTGPALTRDEVLAAIEVGIETARDLVAAGNKALLTGEMGIANTTASAALICVYTGVDASEVTGRGTGINDEMHARKVDVVRRALDLHQPDASDPVGVLAAVGGLEHAAMAGFLLGGASLRTPVILDGVSAGAAALVARAIAPEALAACIAGHRSAEPGHVAALNKLGLRPLVDLDLRLGEGTGALLALPIVQSAARAMHEVATFDAAGVTEK
ncbi:nicotinate-nucleotide--dimethylbenzimidazole phosphoribosyltransferase [Streptomyces sp. cmx-18-6]|uniref:nicotinate-nucleotide--dimethylbenzimidazole phosphoribosyltransferase n=1 Tax=Streptomyces sp. cmx-18-6 TaxID=2790930 RepID=UPI00397F0F07